jgi:hypothetical protein
LYHFNFTDATAFTHREGYADAGNLPGAFYSNSPTNMPATVLARFNSNNFRQGAPY